MSCGRYCYQRQWDCRAGRLKKLSQVQIKPSPTRNYGSEGPRANSIRRRVARYTKNNNNIYGNKSTPEQTLGYGPVFGTAKAPSVFNNCGGCGDRTTTTKNVYRSNGGTGGDVVYWKRVMGGPRQLTTGNNTAVADKPCGMNAQCDSNKAARCGLGGKNFLNHRRGVTLLYGAQRVGYSY
jgi:hypothetical protein